MRIQLSLADRVRILKKLLNATPTFKDDTQEYKELTLESLVEAGLPQSAMNPAYWSGTGPGIRAAIICGKVTWISVKLGLIRFRDITSSEKLVWEQRLAKQKSRTVFSAILEEDQGMEIENDGHVDSFNPISGEED